MSELRKNPATGRWVIIAGDRGRRPHEFAQSKQVGEAPPFSKDCPFCPGNESQTPPAVLEFTGSAAHDSWQIRGFPNKFSALSSGPPQPELSEGPLFVAIPGEGAHEVLVETPMHNRFPASRTSPEIARLMQAYQQRYLELVQQPATRYVLIFKNQGEEAGTSLVHPHSQIVAAPVLPESVRARGAIAKEHFVRTGLCLYCQIAQEEIRLDRRVVYSDRSFVVFHPFAASRPAETWIVPMHHQPSFGQAGGEELTQFATILLQTLRQLKAGFGDPDFNYMIHSRHGEGIDEEQRYWHWHLQIIPRLTRAAGLELGSGIYINTLPPEISAQMMRQAPI